MMTSVKREYNSLERGLLKRNALEEQLRREREEKLGRQPTVATEKRPEGKIFADIGQTMNMRIKTIQDAVKEYKYLTFAEIRKCGGPDLREATHKTLVDALAKNPRLTVAGERIDYKVCDRINGILHILVINFYQRPHMTLNRKKA